MEIVAATPGGGAPFRNHDVREWSRLDSITGVLERARLETDHWTANTATTSHKYNKVVDSRARAGVDGNLQQARRKLEVFQSQIPGGRVQVIKTQTQTVSTNRWSSSQAVVNGDNSVFEDLKLSLNPLDLTSEKAKASVGRGVGRRPPSRSRIRDDILARNSNLQSTATTNLHRVSRLCHQLHTSAVKQTFGKFTTSSEVVQPSLSIDERESGDGVEITELAEHEDSPPSAHTNLSRTKSTSSEDFFEKRKSLEDLEDLEQLQTWRRTSKIRRSLQYPKQKELQPSKPADLPVATGSVRKIREELETGRRLSTALRGNTVDLDALDQILKSISNSSISSQSTNDNEREEEKGAGEEEAEADGVIITAKKQKRDSFVTVESIQAVRDKLRRTSSPLYEPEEANLRQQPSNDDDDGIVSDKPVNLKQLNNDSEMHTRPKYHSSMEANNNNNNSISKKQISGTGSLESPRNKFNSSYNKQDDWFTRRKSYGFEQMHQPHAGNGNSLKNKNRNESSTDSGICRSTEIVVVSPPSKVNRRDLDFNDVIKDDNVTNVKKYAMIFENKNDNKNAIKIASRHQSNNNNTEGKRHSIAVDESKYMSTDNKEDQFKRTSLVFNDTKEDDTKKSNKKVEFCKTEVHFAADSGRVNIVETDEKPPPTQRFRRRRRNSGPTIEEYNKNGLPVQHFGDSTYEKFLFGESTDEPSNGIYENLQPPKPSGHVTVNAIKTSPNSNYFDLEDEPQKDSYESEAPRGILKNKPIKPKPFLLGAQKQNNLEDSSWGQLKNSIIHEQEQQPLWKSTVTLKNEDDNSNDNENMQSEQLKGEPKEFQMLRQQLRPTSRRLDYNGEGEKQENLHFYSAFKDMRLLSPPIDERCSSWSVADRVKQVEELKWTENKGYSTKVNFGDGEATVVENRHTTWPRKDEFKELKKRNLLNKGLVVRIGQNEHKVCSKTMTNNNANGTTTTTKITIDLTPSPTNNVSNGNSNDFKFPRAAIQTFKSPSLIMSTFARTDEKLEQPPQLEDLKQMYEDAHSDTEEADKEVHRILMNSTADEQQSSVLSGSWSKMRAFKQVKQFEKTRVSNSSTVVHGSHNHSLVEKDSSKLINDASSNYKYKLINEQIEKDLKYLNQEVKNLNLNNSKIGPLSNYHEKLSSPFLVGQSRSRASSFSSDTEPTPVNQNIFRRDPSPSRFIPTSHSVLRQPKKSEMAYFGVKTSSTTAKTTSSLTTTTTGKLSEKPDLLQFNNTDSNNKSTYISSAPIYENMTSRSKPSFDSSILEELTKAADEILLAVNGYTDEERSRMSTDDELRARRRNEKLDTITENRSWKQQTTKVQSANSNFSSRLRNDKNKSSNSSIDSITREVHRSFEQLDKKSTYSSKAKEKTRVENQRISRKKVSSSDASSGHVKTTTKARRLQRASSREALLHSHGSSSEDLSNHQTDVVRKPRLVKRTKTTQLSVTNGLEMKKPSRKPPQEAVVHKSKHSERMVESNLPEIRHKTAVSTIRSTAEKQAASRERAKLKNEESKKRQTTSTNTTTKRESSHKVNQSNKAVDRNKRRQESSRHTAIFNQNTKKTTRSDAITTKH